MGRSTRDYIIIGLKGMGMGAADVVPGVSGGTIAFISGIYEELLTSISSIKFSSIKLLKQKGFKVFWKTINGNFLTALVIGIFISILSLAKIISWLLENEPILVWSFFFGLVFFIDGISLIVSCSLDNKFPHSGQNLPCEASVSNEKPHSVQKLIKSVLYNLKIQYIVQKGEGKNIFYFNTYI